MFRGVVILKVYPWVCWSLENWDISHGNTCKSPLFTSLWQSGFLLGLQGTDEAGAWRCNYRCFKVTSFLQSLSFPLKVEYKGSFVEEIRVNLSWIDDMPSFLLHILLHVVSVVMVKDIPCPPPLPNEIVISDGEMSAKPEGNLLWWCGEPQTALFILAQH